MTPNQPLHDGDRPRSGAGLFARKGLIRRALRYGGMIVILCAAVLVAGFLVFADSVTGMRPPETVKADAIVVLGAGSVLGEMAVLDGAPRSATCTTVTAVQAAGLAQRLFALDEDVQARAVGNDLAKTVDYAGFVELSLQYDKVNSWL